MTSLAATVADWSEVFRLATFQGGLNATTVTVGTLLLSLIHISEPTRPY